MRLIPSPHTLRCSRLDRHARNSSALRNTQVSARALAKQRKVLSQCAGLPVATERNNAGAPSLRMQFGGFLGRGNDPASFTLPSAATGRQPVVGIATIAGTAGGKTKQNEDSAIQTLGLTEDDVNLFAVFDGHGPNGQKVAQYIAANYPEVLRGALYDYEGSPPSIALTESFYRMDEMCWTNLGVDPLSQSGATGTVVVQRGGGLLVGSIGDSRAILGGPGRKLRVLTKEHNPADKVERARIEASGGEVSVFDGEPPVDVSGVGRVFMAGYEGPGLATSRSFGDLLAKQVGVTAEPEFASDAALKGGHVLIVASDGVWDVLDDNTALTSTLEFVGEQDAETAAGVLVDASRIVWESRPGAAEGRIDDITALVVFF